MADHDVRLSKRLSYLLRHDPSAVGIELSSDGWVGLVELLAAMADHGDLVTAEQVRQVVAASPKQRFELAEGRIRAAQGHSVAVNLGLVPLEPQEVLYHGTVARFLPAIREEGLKPGKRTHVHLCNDRQTALEVGRRRGAPIVLTIEAGELARSGQPFFRAANGVWLTSHVAPEWIKFERD